MEIAIALTLAAAVVAGLLVGWQARQRRVAVRKLCDERGWIFTREGECTVVTPGDSSWIVRMTQSYAAQQSSTTRIVTSVWSAESPRVHQGALIAGPTPPDPLRDLAVQLVGSVQPHSRLSGWLGLARVGDGMALRQISAADSRLLVFGTGELKRASFLSGVADAVDVWTADYSSEREQAAVRFDEQGVQVRVRVNVLRSADQLAAFVELGTRCAASLGNDFG